MVYVQQYKWWLCNIIIVRRKKKGIASEILYHQKTWMARRRVWLDSQRTCACSHPEIVMVSMRTPVLQHCHKFFMFNKAWNYFLYCLMVRSVNTVQIIVTLDIAKVLTITGWIKMNNTKSFIGSDLKWQFHVELSSCFLSLKSFV